MPQGILVLSAVLSIPLRISSSVRQNPASSASSKKAESFPQPFSLRCSTEASLASTGSREKPWLWGDRRGRAQDFHAWHRTVVPTLALLLEILTQLIWVGVWHWHLLNDPKFYFKKYCNCFSLCYGGSSGGILSHMHAGLWVSRLAELAGLPQSCSPGPSGVIIEVLNH